MRVMLPGCSLGASPARELVSRRREREERERERVRETEREASRFPFWVCHGTNRVIYVKQEMYQAPPYSRASPEYTQ